MPADFEKCVAEKGSVKTISLKGGRSFRICYDKAGKSHAGEVKEAKK